MAGNKKAAGAAISLSLLNWLRIYVVGVVGGWGWGGQSIALVVT